MMLFVESGVLWVATFAVGLSLFYLGAKFEAHDKADANTEKPS
jgi:hypothetical protein